MYVADLPVHHGHMDKLMMNKVRPGDHLRVRDAFGQTHDATATSGVQEGNSFRIIWAVLEGRPGAQAVPWPIDDVETTVASTVLTDPAVKSGGIDLETVPTYSPDEDRFT